MQRRCGAFEVGGIGILPDHRLAFAGWSTRWQGAVATIVPKRDSQVPGVLFRVGPLALEALDRFEGHPFAYRRATVRVFGPGDKWRAAEAYAIERPVEGAPGPEYLDVIKQAYRAWGFDRVARFRAALESHAKKR
jgi:gamma-glutamylcyclotransferase (GGCT)/AIG2-like uncharacterized protein YtfP